MPPWTVSSRPSVRAFALASAVLLCSCGSSSQVWFTPSEEVRNVLAAEYSAASEYIHVAIFTFTDTEIASSLKDAARKVPVQVCADEEQTLYSKGTSNLQTALLEDLESAGVEVRLGTGKDGGILHDKFSIIDERLVFTGSFNYTLSAVERNQENLVLLNDPRIATDYELQFQQIWKSCASLQDAMKDSGNDSR